jgi:hypothetical protein
MHGRSWLFGLLDNKHFSPAYGCWPRLLLIGALVYTYQEHICKVYFLSGVSRTPSEPTAFLPESNLCASNRRVSYSSISEINSSSVTSNRRVEPTFFATLSHRKKIN